MGNLKKEENNMTNEAKMYRISFLVALAFMMSIGGINNIQSNQTTLGLLQLLISCLSAYIIYLQK